MANSKNKKILSMVQKADRASRELSLVSTADKNAALKKMVNGLKKNTAYLIRENNKDLKAAENKNYSSALVDRLTLNKKRIDGMIQCLKDTINLKDPVGEVLRTTKRPNGLVINKVRTPIGVIGIIFESRPNVTSDCIGLCLKSGNAVILKGGKEAFYSNQAIFSVLKKALKNTKIPQESIQLISSTDRASVNIMLGMDAYIDMIIPRGGEGLIRFVAQNTKIPVVKHYKGICHTYVSNKANLKMAGEICFNAKVQRPGVCNAMETMLVHKSIAKRFLPGVAEDLSQAGVELRGDAKTRKILKTAVKKAKEQDWHEEYLDLILSVRVVDDLKAAIDHINHYGSGHSECIVTKDKKEADRFLKGVDSSSLFVNASTRFADGYEFGLGAEIGISTDKLHARGPMALEELTTYKYEVRGKGQIRN